MAAAQMATDEQVRVETARIVKLALVSDFLSSEDESKLRAYFNANGLTRCWGTSPTASIIARMKMFTTAKQTRPCERCGGSSEADRPGTGFANRPDAATPGEAALRAFVEAAERRLRAEAPELPPDFGDVVCRDCDGTGWVTPGARRRRRTDDRPGKYIEDSYTAQPTGSSKQGGSGGHFALAEADIELVGYCSSRLAYVRLHQGTNAAEAALGDYYSDGGNYIGALWKHTGPGKTLLRKNKHRLPPEQFFANLREHERTSGDSRSATLFLEADRAARSLLRTACRLWNQGAADA